MLAGAPTPKCWEAENYNGSNLKATTRAEGKHLESIGAPGKLRAKLGGYVVRQYLKSSTTTSDVLILSTSK